MRKLAHNFILLLVLAGVASGQAISSSEARKRTEILDVLERWAVAVQKRDGRALDQLFADELSVTTYDGEVRGKKEELEVLKPNQRVTTLSVRNEDVAIKLYGDTAVVTALTKMEFLIAEKPSSVALRYTAAFVKKKGRWQLVALQTARAKPPQPK